VRYIYIIFLIFSSYFSNFIFSQKVEIGTTIAYSFPNSNAIIGKQEIDINGNQYSISNIIGSFSSGLNYGLTTNLKIHEHVKLCLGFDFLKGNEIILYNYDVNDTILKISGKGIQQRFSPGVIFYFPAKKVSFYAKTSLVLPLTTETEITESKSSNNISIYHSKKRLDYNFNLGFQYAIGAELNLNKSLKLSLSMESLLNSMTLQSSKMTEFSQNGIDILANQSEYTKNSNFHKNLNNFSNNLAYNNFTTSDKAKDDLTFNHDFSSFLLKFSLIYVLNSKIQD
jgi:hypothetical protein